MSKKGKDADDEDDGGKDGDGKGGVRVGFDLGGTKMYAVAYDGDFAELGRDRRKTKGHQGAEAGVARMVDTVRDCLKDAGVEEKDLAGLGVGVPGVTDLESGTLLNTANLGWKDVPLRKLLEEEFGCPVTLCNDVDAGVFGEFRFGAAQGKRCVLGVFPGTGIGGGLVYEGRIFRGSRLSCLEIGHLPVQPGGPRSGVGHRGTLEAVASRLSVAAAASHRRPPRAGPAADEGGRDGPGGHPQRGALRQRRARRRGREAGPAGRRRDDRHGRRRRGEPARPRRGGPRRRAWWRPCPTCSSPPSPKAAEAALMPAFRGTFEVVPAKLGDEAAVMGAAAWQRREAEEG